ncbi:FAD-dependent oxidoreductase [Anaerotalea alkaliphila]|uniref:FAD-dependent oxidoreductase n=1 Tax=Anaerotalea alkaliphila TaxID=2662126 RepID=A0A7X5KL56_9FIRM|nr:FAD-dependent oxidoreductase [Anaerotalea alkaliphila]NDL66349.1 FAD-dependent oxidoreductase [Anaerotalea alkaliphila]
MEKAFRCMVCGYVHYGEAPPESCPLCGVGPEMFEEIENTRQPAADAVLEADRPKGDWKVVVVGGGVAGFSAVQEIRNENRQVQVTLVSGEPHLPYYRMGLTKYLAGEMKEEDLPLEGEDWYGENGIRLLRGAVVEKVRRENREVVLGDGRILPYDALVLATGGNPFVPPIEGADKAGVHTVRTLDDAKNLLEGLAGINTCICIGGGLLGLETAGAIARKGVGVKVLEGLPWLMPRQLNRQAAEVLKGHVEAMGMEVREGVKIVRILGEGACEGVALDTGEEIRGDMVVITAGIRPETGLAKAAGLEVEGGIVVDDRMRTSDPAIHAAGDCAQHRGVLYGVWPAAQYQGMVAGLNAVSVDTEFGGIPRAATLKVLEVKVTSVGDAAEPEDTDVLLESAADGNYTGFLLRGDRLSGAILIGNDALAFKAKEWIEKEKTLGPECRKDVASLQACLEK